MTLEILMAVGLFAYFLVAWWSYKWINKAVIELMLVVGFMLQIMQREYPEDFPPTSD